MVKTKGKTGITGKHYLDFAQASSAQTTLTAYGKLIKNSETQPSSAGISHPHGLNEPLQASLVYGVAIGGRCIPLPSPEQVMLPAPDGPADGCGWDPTEYVVWKNLPRNWVTTHFQVRPRTLAGALLPVPAMAELDSRLRNAALAGIGVDDRVVAMVRTWADMSSDPSMTDELETLWDAQQNGNPPSDFKQGGAQTLADLVFQDFRYRLLPSDFYSPGTSLKTVGGLVKTLT